MGRVVPIPRMAGKDFQSRRQGTSRRQVQVPIIDDTNNEVEIVQEDEPRNDDKVWKEERGRILDQLKDKTSDIHLILSAAAALPEPTKQDVYCT